MLSRAVTLACVVCWAIGADESRMLSDEFVAEINRRQTLWKAGRNFHEKSSLSNMLSLLPDHDVAVSNKTESFKIEGDLPKSFDSSTKWKHCPSIGVVADQGNCAGGWAMAPSSVLTDRLCIAGVANVNVSAQHVLSCCAKCGAGCFGGYVTKSLRFLQDHGAPSGSAIRLTGCQPYVVKKCNSVGSTPLCTAVRDPTPQCAVYSCTNSAYKVPLGKDFYKVSQVYPVTNNAAQIRQEIYSNGPVLAVMDVYEDLFSYKYGVYSHVLGKLLGRQEIKLIGWGVDSKNAQYWVAVNSWGTKWGIRGVLKIAAGTNECNVEARVLALKPKV